jgi:hypothetical protein
VLPPWLVALDGLRPEGLAGSLLVSSDGIAEICPRCPPCGAVSPARRSFACEVHLALVHAVGSFVSLARIERFYLGENRRKRLAYGHDAVEDDSAALPASTSLAWVLSRIRISRLANSTASAASDTSS